VQACGGLTNPAAVRSAILLVRRGLCSFDDKVQAGLGAGALAVIIGNSDNSYITITRSASGAVATPCGVIPQVPFGFLESLLGSSQMVVAEYVGQVKLEDEPSYESIDPSSSVGLTADGRVKPDLVAPGTISSVEGGSQCGYTVKGGTSMAAPAVAGAAAIVRQYFADAFYPGGQKGLGVVHSASGSLVKAVLIGGAHSLRGFSGLQALPLAAPSGVQGWGRVSLIDSLPLKGQPTVANLQMVDLEVLSEAGQEHVFCLNANAGAPLTVTLVWHDPAASYRSKEVLLVNDLDLEVRIAALGGLSLHANGGPRPDRVNNVERVRLDDPPAGGIAVVVRAHRLMSEQHYSLVVQGSLSGLLQSSKNPAVGGEGALLALLFV
jgi:hypothetical protein